MTECRSCKGRAQLFLCGKCVTNLRSTLESFPWWLSRLVEAEVSQVRHGDGGRRVAHTMHGDDRIDSHVGILPGCKCQWPPNTVAPNFIGPLAIGWRRRSPEEDSGCTCDVAIARQARERRALVQALAIGRVNASASELLDDIGDGLGTWIRHLCESRGVETPGLATAVRKAGWLRNNVQAIACDEAAGEIYDEIADLHKRMERTVNRRQPPKFLGHCPTWIEETKTVCGRQLSAPADAIQTRCRDCGQTHNCNRLQLLLVGDQEREKVTMARVRYLNRNLPPEYRIPERTMRQWITDGRLRPRGYLRADGTRSAERGADSDEPLYLWADVRRIRSEPGRVKTRAAKSPQPAV